MKKYNASLALDMALLKSLHIKKDKSSFNVIKNELMQKYKISKATVYRELKKDMPGTYKVPNYKPPKMDISIEEALLVRELLLQGRQNQEIIKIMTRELGFHYYWDRFDRVRKIAEELDETVFDPKRSYFAERGNMFFEKLLGMEFMSEESYRILEINGKKIHVSKKTLEMLKVYLMRDNPVNGEPASLKFMQDEIIFHEEMEEGIRRKLYQIHKTGETPSAYALKSLLETKQLIEKRESAIIKMRRKLMEERKLLAEENQKQECKLITAGRKRRKVAEEKAEPKKEN